MDALALDDRIEEAEAVFAAVAGYRALHRHPPWEMTMRNLACILSVLLVVAACGDDTVAGGGCEHLEVDLPTCIAEGSGVFEGTVDGEPFRCEYSTNFMNPWRIVVHGRCAEGPVEVVVQGSDDCDDAFVRFHGRPERVDWDFTFDNLGSVRDYEGTFEPSYEGGDCRNATFELPL